MPSESELHKSTGLHVTIRDPRGGEAINLNFDREFTELPLVVEFPSRTARAVLRVHHLKDAGEYDVRLSFTTDPAPVEAAVVAAEASREDSGGFSEADERAMRERAAVQGYSDDDLSRLMSGRDIRSEAEARAAFEEIVAVPRDKLALAVTQAALSAAEEILKTPTGAGVTLEQYRLALETMRPIDNRQAAHILEGLIERASAERAATSGLKRDEPLPPPVTDAKLPVETNVVAETPLTESKGELKTEAPKVEAPKVEAPKVEEKKAEGGKAKHGGGSRS